MTTEEQAAKQPHGIHDFRNRLFWRWADEMPRPLREGFLKVLHAFGAGANAAGSMVFRDGRVITLKEIARAACVDPKDARRYIDAAQAAGVVTMAGERKRGHTPVYTALVIDSPDWEAAVAHLRVTVKTPNRRAAKVWEDAPRKGDALPSTHTGGTGDAPPSENGGCTPEGKGDAPPTSQGVPSNYPKDSRGDGRRPTTGSGGAPGSGSAARQDENPAEGIAAADIRAVITALPLHLRKQLERVCQTVPDAITDTIRRELKNGLTVDQLITRIARRWTEQRFEDDALSASGRGLDRPIGVAEALIRHGNCPHPLCDDGTDLVTDADCRTCERTREDRRPTPQEPVQGAFPVVLPAARPEAAPAPRERLVPRDCSDPVCPNSYPAPKGAPAGLCPDCRPSAREASNA